MSRLFCLFYFRLFAFTEAAAVVLVVLRSSICMRFDSHTQLPNSCLLLIFCFFGGVTFSDYVCAITGFSMCGEYVVHFPVADDVLLLCDHGLSFLHQFK